jgi:hypothetical protein
MRLVRYPLYTVFFSRTGDDLIMESPDFYELEEALDFFDSIASEFKQINRYDSYESPTQVILQTTASAERSGYGLFV